MMKKYDSYKDSGIQWIGEIPSHWKLMKIKHLSKLITETSNCSVKIGLENIESFSGRYIETDSSFEGNGVKVQKGDIVYGKLRPYLCKAWHATFDCNAVGDFYVFRCESDECINTFLHKIFLSHGFTGICNASTYGAKMPRVSSGFIQSLQIPIPPISEQQAIVSYLDRKVKEMDKFVSGKEQMIDKLKELKQAVIAKAVTKGINPNVKLKPSGISWIGDVPEHWETKKIKYIFTETSEKGYPEEPVLCSTQKYGVIPQSLYENRVVVVNKGLEGLKFVQIGNFVISLRSFQGGIEYAYYQGIISVAYTILKLNPGMNPDYMKLLCKSYDFIQLLQTCVTGIREGQNINYGLLRKQSIPAPPEDEQQAIVDYITYETTQIDKLIVEYTYEVEYMKELKQRLISDVVTGKIKVVD